MKRSTSIPRSVKNQALGKFLAGARTDDERWLVLGSNGVILLQSQKADFEPIFQKPWHEVSHGTWDGVAESLTITWVDGEPELALILPQSSKEIPITFKEYVDRSIVIARTKKVGDGATVRVAIRKNENGEIFTQTTVLGARRALASYDEAATQLEAEVLEMIGH